MKRRYFRRGVGVKTALCGYRWSLLHCGTACWTGSGRDVRLQLAVNLESEDEDAAEWIKGSSWCITDMLTSSDELYQNPSDHIQLGQKQ